MTAGLVSDGPFYLAEHDAPVASQPGLSVVRRVRVALRLACAPAKCRVVVDSAAAEHDVGVARPLGLSVVERGCAAVVVRFLRAPVVVALVFGTVGGFAVPPVPTHRLLC